MLDVSGVIHTRAMCYGSSTTTPRGRTIADRMDEMRRDETTKARDRARCPQMDRVRGMSNHMCLNMDPGGRIDAVKCDVMCVLRGWRVGKKKTTSRDAAVVGDARA